MQEHEPAGRPGTFRRIAHELRHHVPFTIFGAVTGILIAVAFVYTRMPPRASHGLFMVFHPAHVLLSTVVTTAMFRLHARRGFVATLLVGYVGSVGIGTLSDSLIPYVSELLLQAHDQHIHAHVHLGFIEEWYLVNPAALVGIALAYWRPKTRMPHAGHVLVSTWASLSHILMSAGSENIGGWTLAAVPVILFVAVWVPCCTSDIVFPLLFAGGDGQRAPVQDGVS